MSRFSKFKDWSNSFENKAVGLVAFYGAITGAIALIPSLIYGIFKTYLIITAVLNILNYIERFENSIEYLNFMVMQQTSVLHGETDSKNVHGTVLETTNGGDVWLFTDVEINGIKRPIIYSANVKRKANKEGYYIYIQNIKGKNEWVK